MKGSLDMASQLKKTRTITDKISVKGILSEDAATITYIDENKSEQDITVTECLNIFKGKAIDFSISEKSEEDLDTDE